MTLRKYKWLLTFALLIALMNTSIASAATLQKEIESSLMCPVCPTESVANCPDSTSAQIRQEIAAKIAAGETKQQIIASYVELYGRQILAVPTTSGFDLTAWVMPFVGIFMGGGVIVLSLRKWISKEEKSSKKSSKHQAEELLELDKYQDRLEEELKKYR